MAMCSLVISLKCSSSSKATRLYSSALVIAAYVQRQAETPAAYYGAWKRKSRRIRSMSSNRWALIRAESSKVRLRPSDTQAVQQTSHRWRLKRECPLACFRFLRSGSRGRAFYKSLLRHCIRTGAAAKSPVILILRRWLCAQVEAGWKLSPARACFAFDCSGGPGEYNPGHAAHDYITGQRASGAGLWL